jgi:outer membrane cobalamin receptor
MKKKILMHFFQNSLSGATLSWFIRLSQIANINFNSSFPTKKPKTQTNQVNNQIENILKKNHQTIQKQLPR